MGALPFRLGTYYSIDEPNIACPVCGGDYSHIGNVGTLIGSDEHEALIYHGTGMRGCVEERRSALAIVFDGECGHRWQLRIQQHKGVNLLEVYRLPAPPPEHDLSALPEIDPGAP
jgi:hypothetical protein